jgi:hypothetical protein
MRHYDGTPLVRTTSRGDETVSAWARHEAKSEAMEADLCAQFSARDPRESALDGKLARVATALVAYGLIAAIMLGSLYLSLQPAPRGSNDADTLAGVDNGSEHAPLPRFGPFRP